MAYAENPRLYFEVEAGSPLDNVRVGRDIVLEDFTRDQVGDVNRRYGAPLDEDGISTLYGLAGGHPYLTRRGLAAIKGGLSLDDLIHQIEKDGGPFRDHLLLVLSSVSQDPELVDAIWKALRNEALPDTLAFDRLRSAGVIDGESRDTARIRCRVYDLLLCAYLPQ